MAVAAGSPAARTTEPVRRPAAFDDLHAVRDEWSALAEGVPSVFSTWEWASTWYRHLGDDRPLLLRTARSDSGRIDVVLPMYLWRSRPLRVVRFLGHDQGD